MPVVNLPQDMRFGDLGKGLGGLVSGIVNNIQQQQTSAAVSEIMQDQTIPEPAKYAKILKDHGTLGQELYTKAVQNQLTQAKIKDTLSEVGLRTVQTAAEQAKMEKLFPEQVAKIKADTANIQSETTRRGALLPGEITQQTAQTGLTGAETGNITSQAEARRALLPGQLAEQPAKTKLTEAQTGLTEVEAGIGAAKLPKVLVENEIAKLQLDIIKGNVSEGGASDRLDALGKKLGLTPDLIETAKASFRAEKDPLKKDEAFMKVVTGQKQAEARAQIPSEAPTDVRKQTTNAVEAATSMDRFLSSFRTGGAEKIGNIGDILKGESPAALKVWLERHGFATGDENLLNMWNSSIQNVQSVATSGGGFFAEGRVKLAKDVTPSISETPLHSIIAADQVADRQIAALENQKLNLAPKQSKAGIDDALAKWRGVKAVTGTLNSYVTNPGTANERTVMMFDGNQIDPKSFKKLVEGGKTYEFKGANITGATLIDEARKRNVAPDVFRDQLKKYYESRR